jgi:hypothetical protein
VRGIFLGIRRPFIRIIDASPDQESIFREIIGKVVPLFTLSEAGAKRN